MGVRFAGSYKYVTLRYCCAENLAQKRTGAGFLYYTEGNKLEKKLL